LFLLETGVLVVMETGMIAVVHAVETLMRVDAVGVFVEAVLLLWIIVETVLGVVGILNKTPMGVEGGLVVLKVWMLLAVVWIIRKAAVIVRVLVETRLVPCILRVTLIIIPRVPLVPVISGVPLVRVLRLPGGPPSVVGVVGPPVVALRGVLGVWVGVCATGGGPLLETALAACVGPSEPLSMHHTTIIQGALTRGHGGAHRRGGLPGVRGPAYHTPILIQILRRRAMLDVIVLIIIMPGKILITPNNAWLVSIKIRIAVVRIIPRIIVVILTLILTPRVIIFIVIRIRRIILIMMRLDILLPRIFRRRMIRRQVVVRRLSVPGR